MRWRASPRNWRGFSDPTTSIYEVLFHDSRRESSAFGADGGGGVILRFLLWMSRRNGRAVARRLASEGKASAQLEKIIREELKPLSRNLSPELQERLLAEGVSAASEWWRKHGSRTG